MSDLSPTLVEEDRPAASRRKPSRVIARCTTTLGMVSIWWAQRVENMLWPMNTVQAVFYVQDRQGGEIAECRNMLVDQVLQHEARTRSNVTHIFWVDDDVLINPGVLHQLLLHEDEADIVSGVYFLKAPGPASQPLIFPEPIGGTARFVPDCSYPVWGHGMGLTLVKLDVYKRMLKAGLPKDRYGRPEWYRTTGGRLEDLEVDENGCLHTGFTEDTYFLDLCRQMGVRSVVDTHKHALGWHFDAATGQGYPEEQWGQLMRGEPIRWQTSTGEVVWD